MIIIVTNKEDYTSDYLILELLKRGVDYVRFNTEDFPTRIKIVWKLCKGELEGYFSFPEKRVTFEEVHSIWFRRPVSAVPSPQIRNSANRNFVIRESKALLDGIWKTIDCFCVSPIDNLRKAENKLYQLKIASIIGFNIWPTIVTNSSRVAKGFYEQQTRDVVYKPLRYNRLVRNKTVKLIYTNPVRPPEAERLAQVTFAPSLLQSYIPKRVEIRATVIGGQVFAVEIHSQDCLETKHDWRRVDSTQLNHQPHMLPGSLKSMCISLVKELGLYFGAIDLILTPDGEYVFLEINPNGQWAWIQQLCPEIPLRETLADLLINGPSIQDA